MSVFGAGARDKWPSPAANAQVMFDCWMEEQEENIQPKDIARCRAGFFAAMAQIDKAMMAKPAAKKPEKKMAKPMPMAALPGPFIVYFGFDSSAIDRKNAAVVRDAAAAAKKGKAKEVVLQGHADRSGSSAYNTGLSQRRVDAVAAALGRAGVKSGMIGKARFGEQQPTVSTPDGKREGRNRRVEIYLSR
jgi:OOP family OmpA-OmpF porin